MPCGSRFGADRKSTRLNSSHTVIYTLSLHDALPILDWNILTAFEFLAAVLLNQHFYKGLVSNALRLAIWRRSEEHTSELQSHRDLHSFPTRRSSDLGLEHPHCLRVSRCSPLEPAFL